MLNRLEVHESFATYGTKAATNSDLLALLIGNEEKAEKLTNGAPDVLAALTEKNYCDLLYAGGLTQKEAQRLAAAIELGKRLAYSANIPQDNHITSPGDAAAYFMPIIRHENHEKFYLMCLNTKNRPIKVLQIAEGSLTSAVVHPREVFAEAVTCHAACIMVAHNHPSGDPYPSADDRNLTRALDEAGHVLGIPLLDHIVIGDGRYYSFKEHGDM